MTDRKITAMHLEFGVGSGQCKGCPHFVRFEYHNRLYYKCRAYGLSNSEATDWRCKYTACGLTYKPTIDDLVPMIERLKHGSRKEPEQPIEGQIGMEGLL